MVQNGLSKKQDPISKIIRTKRARGIAQVIEHLAHKLQALSSNPNTITLPHRKKGDSALFMLCSKDMY
jgi:hypothetical protein